MKRAFRNAVGALLLVLVLLPVPLRAQTNPPPDRSSRYLFIVDTSAAMRRRAPAVQRVVENLLRSSMAAQFRPGDTVGVWTYDQELSAGKLPLQLWSPDRAPLVATNVLGFLSTLRYEKKASNFENVLPALHRVIQDSTRLTVLLLSDGNERISGTPFDGQIEAAFAENYKVQEKTRMPYVTVLRAVRGQLRGAAVNQAPWPVEFPEWPPEVKLVEAPKARPAELKPAPRPTLPPLIVIGKKPEAVATNAGPASTDTPATTPSAIVATNLPPGAAPAEPLGGPAVPTTNPPEASTAPPTVVTNAAAAPTAPLTPAAESKPSEPPPRAVTNPAPVAVVVASAETPASVVPPATNVPPAAPVTNPPVPIALAVQPEPAFGRMSLVAIGAALLLLAVALFLLLRHRARRQTGRVSLITRSMDRDQQ